MPLPRAENDPMQFLFRHCHQRRYPGKSLVFEPGDPGLTLYHILEGSVSVIMCGGSDRGEMVIGYLNRGDFIGEVCVFTGPSPRRLKVQTREPTILAEIGYDRLLQLLRTDLADHAAELLLMFGRHVSRKLLELRDRKVRRLVFEDAADRVLHCLLDLCGQPEAMTHPDGMQIRISRQEIGRIVGCSRELAGHVIQHLADANKISAHGKTIVVYGVGPQNSQ